MTDSFLRSLVTNDRSGELMTAPAVEELTPAKWTAGMSAAFRDVRNEWQSTSSTRAYRPILAKRTTALRELGYETVGLYTPDPLDRSQAWIAEKIDSGEIALDANDDLVLREAEGSRALWGALFSGGNKEMARNMAAVAKYSQMFPDKVQTDAQIWREVSTDLAVRRRHNQSMMQRSPGSATFAGMAAGTTMDPLVLATLPLGYGWLKTSAGVGRNLARAFASEFAIGASTETIIQAEVMDFKEQIESPYSKKEAALMVLGAGVGSGVLRATVGGAIDVTVAANLRSLARARPSLGKLSEDLGVDQRALEKQLAADDVNPDDLERVLAEVERLDENLPPNTAKAAHADAADTAARQADAGEIIDVEAQVPSATFVPGGRVPEAVDDLVALDPAEVSVDAERFQFKEGGDAEGVTNRLKDQTEWKPYLADTVTVWEDKAGTRWIADGHQRLALANRAKAGGQEGVQLRAWIMREADGVTAAEARAWSAFKNITQGTGSAIDGAKVLRDSVGTVLERDAFNLPLTTTVARQGRAIARLEGDAFQAAVNRLIEENQAAIVGELIEGEARQLAAIKVLQKTKPANVGQARAIVEQIKAAGFKTQRTEDLFGEAEIAKSLYIERAKVLDSSLKRLRADKALFSTLQAQEQKIAAAGNRLAKESNRDIAEASQDLIATIQKLANQVGPISDALEAAAAKVAAGTSPGVASRDFVESLRQGLTRDQTRGREAVGAGDRAPEAAAELELAPGKPAIAGDLPELDQGKVLETLTAGQRGKNTVAKIRRGAQKAQEQFNSDLADLGDFPGAELSTTTAKSAKSINSKLERRPYLNGDPSRLTDIVRVSYILHTTESADDIIEAISGRWATIVEDWNTRPDITYTDRALNVVLDDGRVAEVLFLEPHMFKAKGEKGHGFYTKQREMPVAEHGSEAYLALTKAMNELYAGALAKAGPDWADIISGKPGAAGKFASKSARSSSDPSIKSSTGGKGDQASASPGREASTSTKAADSLESITAGKPSIEKKRSTVESSVTGDSVARNADAADLAGPVDRAAQDLADETRARDLARNTGQTEIETGEAGDMFSQARNQLDITDDIEIVVGERTDGTPETVNARQYMDELDVEADGLRAVDDCMKAAA